MESKEYLIGNVKFTLKDYADLTGFEEEKINKLLSPDTQAGNYDIFPLILKSATEYDINKFDWRYMTNKQAAEIIVDFIVEKKSSQKYLQSFITESIKQKLLQSEITNQNMET